MRTTGTSAHRIWAKDTPTDEFVSHGLVLPEPAHSQCGIPETNAKIDGRGNNGCARNRHDPGGDNSSRHMPPHSSGPLDGPDACDRSRDRVGAGDREPQPG